MKTKLEEIEKIIEKRGEFTVLDGAAKITVSFAPNDDSGYFIRTHNGRSCHEGIIVSSNGIILVSTHYVVDYYDDMTPYLDGMREPLMKPSGCEGEPEWETVDSVRGWRRFLEGEPENILNWIEDFIKTIKKEEK